MTYTFFINCLIITILSLGFGLFVAVNRKKAEQMASVYTWIVFCFVVAVWSLGLGMMTASSEVLSARKWLMVHQTGAILTPTLFLQFSFNLSLLSKKRFLMLLACYLFTAFLLALTYTDNLVYPSPNGQFNFYTTARPYYNLYPTYFFFCVGYAFAIFIREFVGSRGHRRVQMKYLLLAQFGHRFTLEALDHD